MPRNYGIRINTREKGKASAYYIAVPVAMVKVLGDGYRDHRFKPELTAEGILYRSVKSERSSDHEQSGDQRGSE